MQVVLVAVVAIVIAETYVLQRIIVELSRLRKIIDPAAGVVDNSTTQAMSLELGETAPSFRVRLFGTTETLTEQSLLGEANVFLFLKESDYHHYDHNLVRSIVAGVWSKSDDKIYIVYFGSRASLSQLIESARLIERFGDHIRFILDSDGIVFSSFRVNVWPSAVVLDESNQVRRIGRLDAHDQAATRSENLDPTVATGTNGVGVLDV